jgi:hypothetical protein
LVGIFLLLGGKTQKKQNDTSLEKLSPYQQSVQYNNLSGQYLTSPTDSQKQMQASTANNSVPTGQTTPESLKLIEQNSRSTLINNKGNEVNNNKIQKYNPFQIKNYTIYYTYSCTDKGNAKNILLWYTMLFDENASATPNSKNVILKADATNTKQSSGSPGYFITIQRDGKMTNWILDRVDANNKNMFYSKIYVIDLEKENSYTKDRTPSFSVVKYKNILISPGAKANIVTAGELDKTLSYLC